MGEAPQPRRLVTLAAVARVQRLGNVCGDRGRQQCDGTVEREISAYLDDAPKFTSATARRLAALLIEAADQLDRWEHEGTSAH